MKDIVKDQYKKQVCFVLSVLFAVFLGSCKKMDDYKKYVSDGEITYTGKLDSVKVLSGNNRVFVRGLLSADPKIVECRIFWNNMADSTSIPITRSSTVDTLKKSIAIANEGVQNFVIYTYDAAGNRSIPVNVAGRTYGARYQATLVNRDISEARTDETTGITSVNFLGMDRLTGVFATDITYTKQNNQSVKIRVPIDSSRVALANFKYGSTISYKTLFLPDTVSIDTFYSAVTTRQIVAPAFIKINVTNTYLKNTGSPFTPVATVSRWGVLTDWTTSASVKNASGSNGGLEMRSGVATMSLEAGWGLPDITNGFIYQTITLPAATYSFEANGLEQNAGGTRYIVVAPGTTMPNVVNIPSAALAFAPLAATTATTQTKLEFTLTQPTQVSIGFAANMTGGSGSAGFYTKIKSVRLYTIQYL